MRVISAAEIEAALDWDSLIERLRQTFRRGVEVPVRHHHDRPGSRDATWASRSPPCSRATRTKVCPR
jgi:ornithine cyclodeaminase